MMRKFTIKQIIVAAFLSSVCNVVGANNITIDPSSIEVLGSHCEAVTADDITIDTKGLKIDLSKMESVREVLKSKSCMIKFNYFTDSDMIKGNVDLTGVYTTTGHEQIIPTIRVSEAGMVGDAGMIVIQKSATGKFRWQQPFKIETRSESKNTLKIVISLLMAPRDTQSEDVTQQPFSLDLSGKAGVLSERELLLAPLMLTVSNVVDSTLPIKGE